MSKQFASLLRLALVTPRLEGFGTKLAPELAETRHVASECRRL
jgi:hypothetical protein